MSWLYSRRRAEAEPAPAPPPPAPERHAAPGLLEALARLDSRPRRILDLGPPLRANVARLARLTPRLAIADLRAELTDGLAPAAAVDQVFTLLPPGGAAEPYELVLAWDLLDHLGRETLPRFAALLAPRCAERCQLHALLATGKAMPALPRRFRILDDDTLEQETSSAEEVPAPRLQPGELDRLLPGFVVEKSRLLAYGAQEVVLARTDHAETPITRVAPVPRSQRRTLPRGRQPLPGRS